MVIAVSRVTPNKIEAQLPGVMTVSPTITKIFSPAPSLT